MSSEQIGGGGGAGAGVVDGRECTRRTTDVFGELATKLGYLEKRFVCFGLISVKAGVGLD